MSADSTDGLLPQGSARIMLRPIASSLPLGFFAFTVGTVLLTALELRWVPVAAGGQLMIMVLAFVVPLEVLSGLFAFLARDSGAATGLLTLGAAWAAYGGLALLLEEGHQRMVLPLGRRGRARTSLEGDFATQVHQAEQEPGSAASCDGAF
jgi:succinate-acetate transporter protein